MCRRCCHHNNNKKDAIFKKKTRNKCCHVHEKNKRGVPIAGGDGGVGEGACDGHVVALTLTFDKGGSVLNNSSTPHEKPPT